MSAKRRLSDEEVAQAVKLYREGRSQDEIAKIFGMSQQGIGKVLGREGVVVKSKSERNGIRTDFFQEIDTEEKVYWIGFLAADGWISENKVIGLSLQERDVEHVRVWAETIGALARKHGERKEWDVQFKSTKMYDDLVRWGFTVNKSKEFDPGKILKKIEQGLVRHFWRGMVDGDGTIPVMIRYGNRRDSLELCGTEAVCRGFKDFCVKNGENANMRLVGNIWNATVNGKSARKMLGVLYDDCNIYLKRKKMIAEGRIEKQEDGIRTIDRETAKEFLWEFHYLKSLPIGVVCYGWWKEKVLKGVAVIGTPANPGVDVTVFGKEGKGKVKELRRFALSSNEKNDASKFLGAVLREIKKEYDWWAMISFADAIAGHYGAIYQACGARYVGRSAKEVFVKIGEEIFFGRGMANALKGKELRKAEVMVSDGKFKYVFFLKEGVEKRCILPARPYPKSLDLK